MARKLPNPDLAWPIILEGVAEIAESEACVLVAYLCPAGKPTCGWGETAGVKLGMEWTQDYADRRFAESMTEVRDDVLAACTNTPSKHELAALVSLVYNIGLPAFKTSSVLRAHNRGDREAAARSFLAFNKARINGVLTVVRGLTSRRMREASMYLTPDPGAPVPAMVQAVADEPKLSDSPTVQTGTAMGVTGAVVLASAVGEQATTVKTAVVSVKSLAVDAFGIPADWFLPVVMILGSAYVVWRRFGQRRNGLA